MTTRSAAPLKDHRVALNGLFQGNRVVAVTVRALSRNLEREAIRRGADPTPSVYQLVDARYFFDGAQAASPRTNGNTPHGIPEPVKGLVPNVRNAIGRQ